VKSFGRIQGGILYVGQRRFRVRLKRAVGTEKYWCALKSLSTTYQPIRSLSEKARWKRYVWAVSVTRNR